MSSYLDRMDQTKDLDQALKPFLAEHGINCYDFGQSVILRDTVAMKAALKRLLVRDYSLDQFGAGFMLKFSPDYICDFEDPRQSPFLLDTKVSLVPMFFENPLKRLRELAITCGFDGLERGDVGEIEREAWSVYSTMYPSERLAICFAAPYNPRLLAMEWCSRIQPFYRFEEDRNLEAGGSGTPHVNIHLGKMRTPDVFLREEFGIEVNAEAYRALVEVVKDWPIQKPKGRINWTQFTNALRRIKVSCPWIKAQMPDEVRKRLYDDRERKPFGN